MELEMQLCYEKQDPTGLIGACQSPLACLLRFREEGHFPLDCITTPKGNVA